MIYLQSPEYITSKYAFQLKISFNSDHFKQVQGVISPTNFINHLMLHFNNYNASQVVSQKKPGIAFGFKTRL